MPWPDPAHPILKAADWPAREVAFTRKLGIASQDPRLPWIAFGFDRGVSFEILTREEVEGLHLGGDELYQMALGNLRARPGRWQPAHPEGQASGPPAMLVCTEDDLACERILDADFLRLAHRDLRAELLAVGIPVRGVMMAMNAKMPAETLRGFATMNLGHFHKQEGAPVTPLTFLVHGTSFVGVVRLT